MSPQISHFDAASEPASERSGFAPMPPVWYKAALTSSALTDNKSGNGSHFKFEFTVLEGKYQSRKVWANVTWTHATSELAVKIGRRAFADLCLACGKASVDTTEELHGIPISIKLKIKPAEGKYEEGNEITAYAEPDINPFPTADTPPAQSASEEWDNAAPATASEGWGS